MTPRLTPTPPLRLFPKPAQPGVVPVYVKMPLDTVSIINTLNYTKALHVGMKALRQVGVEGVSVDCWWGIVEAYGPGEYDWSAYRALFKSVAENGLKLQVGIPKIPNTSTARPPSGAWFFCSCSFQTHINRLICFFFSSKIRAPHT